MSNLKKRIEYLLKHNVFIRKMYRFIMNNLFKFIGIFVKTDKSLVLVNSYGGRKYNDSPKAITDYLQNNCHYRHLKIVWAFENPDDFDIPFDKIKINAWRYFHTALKAQYWITNVNIERWLSFKKKNTIYLNSWHGIPLKLLGKSVKGHKDFNFSNVNIFCYSGNFEKEIYMRDFKVLESALLFSGMPRNDELYNVDNEKKVRIRAKLNIPESKKVILYAPTWRDSEDGGKSYSLKPPVDISFWKDNFAKEYVILFRIHSFTTQLLGIKFDEFIRDVTEYPDINDLMIAADILISDYSAAIFDYAVLERPIISFAYDYEDYRNNRGLYLDLEKNLPDGIVKTQEELILKLKSFNYEEQCLKTKIFKNRFIEQGGNATVMCVKSLFGN